jgi:hypothetical protein
VAAEARAMIASLRGLIVAAAIAVALVFAAVFDAGRSIDAPDRAVLPGFAPDRVTELVWERAGQPAIHVVRAGGWQLRAPSSAPADPDAIDEVLAALRGARWHRRSHVRGTRPGTTTLTVVAGADRSVLGLGDSDAAQGWLTRHGEHLLVDRWVLHALDRDVQRLRIARPFAGAARATTIVIEGEPPASGVPEAHVDLRLAGTPRRLVRPAALLVSADLAAELDHALAELEIVRSPDGPVTGHGLAITLSAEAGVTTVELAGDCPGAPELVAITGTTGDGCIPRAAADGVVRAIARLLQPPGLIAERRPAPFEPTQLVLSDGAVLTTAPLRVADRPADPARVAELLAALAAPADVVALPAGAPAHQLRATAASTITLDLFVGGVLARHGEPIALHLAPGAWQLVTRPSRELRELALWLEEPTTITGVRIDDIRYERGALIGAWSRQPSGPADATTLEALTTALAAPRSLGFVDGTAHPSGGADGRRRAPVVEPFAITHRVTLTVTPPTGAPSEHVLELGAPRTTGCPARVAGDAVLLPAILCTQVAALAR